MAETLAVTEPQPSVIERTGRRWRQSLGVLVGAGLIAATVTLPGLASAQDRLLCIGDVELDDAVVSALGSPMTARLAAWPSAGAVLSAARLQPVLERPQLAALSLADYRALTVRPLESRTKIVAYAAPTWQWRRDAPTDASAAPGGRRDAPVSFGALLTAIGSQRASVALVAPERLCGRIAGAFQASFSRIAEVSRTISDGFLRSGALARDRDGGSDCLTADQLAQSDVQLALSYDQLTGFVPLPASALPPIDLDRWAVGSVLVAIDQTGVNLLPRVAAADR